MTMPKGYLTNINIKNQKIGPERRQELIDGIADKGTYLPKGVLEEDMDQAFIDFVSDDKRMSISVEGVKIPVIFLTIQRWTQFTKTWTLSDKYKNVEMPFITIVRKPDIQQGQNQAGLWNIPGGRTYTYMKVPTWDGIRRGIDLYKVPQPTSVDLTYELRLFTNKMKDLNRFNGKIQRAFQSRQCYIDVNGHPMPLHLETIGDESNIEDFESRIFYVQLFEINLLGYILDEEDFEVVPTINRSILTTEIDEVRIFKDVTFEPLRKGNVLRYAFVFKARAESQFSFVAQYDATFTQMVEIINLDQITIRVNGAVVFDGIVMGPPIIIMANDTVSVKIKKTNNSNLLIGSFKLIGSTV